MDDVTSCARVLARGSKSFAAASRLLPRAVRDDATVLYAFCRVADDLVDDAGASPRQAVARLTRRLDRIYAGVPEPRPVDRALAEVVARTGLPQSLLGALLEGLAWDAEGRRYRTLDDVLAYSARVASSVGAMMAWLMGARSPEALARACDLGAAMQLSNIARDVGEDARRGRIYLPLEWLAEAGVDAEALVRSPAFEPRLGGVVKRLLEVAEGLYARADSGIAMLDPGCRVAIRAARLIYSDIGREVERAGYDSISRRAVVPGLRKLWWLVRAVPARWWRPMPSLAPALTETRFLLEACVGEGRAA